MKLAFEDIVLNGIRNAVEEGGLCGPKPPMSTRRVLAANLAGWYAMGTGGEEPSDSIMSMIGVTEGTPFDMVAAAAAFMELMRQSCRDRGVEYPVWVCHKR